MVYYKCYLTYFDFKAGENKDGYVYAEFFNNDPKRIWEYFKSSNIGARTWAITEISKGLFEAGPTLHPNALKVRVDKYFEETIYEE